MTDIATTIHKIGILQAAKPNFSYSPSQPINADLLASITQNCNLNLPADYRDFLLLIGNGDQAQGCGLYALEESLDMLPHLLGNAIDLKNYFSQIFAPPQLQNNSSEPVIALKGLLPVSMDKRQVYLLAINGKEFGSMWCWNQETKLLAAAEGSLSDSVGHQRCTFLQWYNLWLDIDIARLSLPISLAISPLTLPGQP